MSADTINKGLLDAQVKPEVKYIHAEAKSLLKLTNLVPGDSGVKIGSSQPPTSSSFNFGGFQYVPPLATFSNPNNVNPGGPSNPLVNDSSKIKGPNCFGEPSSLEVKKNCSRRDLLKSSTVSPGNVSVSPHFYMKGHSQWQLNGTMCFNFQDTSLFHVILSMGPGRTNDRVQMCVTLKPCSKANPAFVHLSTRLSTILVAMKFFNSNEEVVETKFMQIQKNNQVSPSWNSFFVTNDSFMSTESLLKICELRPKSEISFFGTLEEFEYVLMEVNIQASFKEDPSPLKSSICEQITPCHKLNFSVASSASQLDTVFLSKNNSTSTESGSQQVKSKYKDFVTFKVGQDEQSFLVYKSILTKCSPVFRKMFQIEMQEKSNGEIKLPNRHPEEMEAFLDYLYCGVSKGAVHAYDEDPGILLSVLELAHLYEIMDIVTKIVNSIVALDDGTLNVSYVMQIFFLGHQYGITDLKFRAVQWVKGNREKVFTAEGQKDIENNLSGSKEIWAAFMADLLSKD